MNEISSEVALSILDAWFKSSEHLQVAVITKGRSQGSPGITARISPSLRSVSLVIVDTAGQKQEWTISLVDCDFSLDKPLEGDSPSGGEYLIVDCPDETRVIFTKPSQFPYQTLDAEQAN
jgi:hypothetical protein